MRLQPGQHTRTSRMGSVKPLGAPLAVASALKLYCVLAMQMGSLAPPMPSMALSCRSASSS